LYSKLTRHRSSTCKSPSGRFLALTTVTLWFFINATPAEESAPTAIANPVSLKTEPDSRPKTWEFKPHEVEQPLLDLRYLNEKVAGETGFVHLSADGNSFVRGDGAPMRFWMVQCNTALFMGGKAQGDQHARWLARLGVNFARVSGGTLNPRAAGSHPEDIEKANLDGTWGFVAAMKKQGIYSMLNPYWAAGGSDLANWGVEGYSGKQARPWGLLFFNPQLQAAYRGWMKHMMTDVNPYTGIPLAQDPSVAVILLQNEDSLLWFSEGSIKGAQRELLCKRFGDFLIQKYSSLDKAVQAWDGTTLPGDKPADGRMELYGVYQTTLVRGNTGADKRQDDQTQFITELMRRFNADTAKYLREELGCKQLIAADNWKPASMEKLLDCERYAYTANEVVAKNDYFGGIHTGGGDVGYNIAAGHEFSNNCVLNNPWQLPINTKQVVGHPNIITESSWVNPNLYQSDMAFMVSVYRSLTGQAGLCNFATGSNTGFDPGISKWSASTPMLAGQWPAAALLYRLGYVRQGPVVVHEERPLADLWQRKTPLITEQTGFDPNHDIELHEGRLPDGSIPPLAYLVGRVEVVYGGDPAKTAVADLGKYIDPAKKIVRSVTGEVELDYGQGICRLDAPKAQGACGFLDKPGEIALSAVKITSTNAYASVLVVAMDDIALTESHKMLVQVGTTARPGGWKTEPAELKPKGWKTSIAGERILAKGDKPWQIAATQVTLEIANAHVTTATLLDTGGSALRTVALEHTDGGRVRIVLPEETMYLILSAPDVAH